MTHGETSFLPVTILPTLVDQPPTQESAGQVALPTHGLRKFVYWGPRPAKAVRRRREPRLPYVAISRAECQSDSSSRFRLRPLL